jgi:hypothetical protein
MTVGIVVGIALASILKKGKNMSEIYKKKVYRICDQ